jgi:hypothetical protein
MVLFDRYQFAVQPSGIERAASLTGDYSAVLSDG